MHLTVKQKTSRIGHKQHQILKNFPRQLKTHIIRASISKYKTFSGDKNSGKLKTLIIKDYPISSSCSLLTAKKNGDYNEKVKPPIILIRMPVKEALLMKWLGPFVINTRMIFDGVPEKIIKP